MNLETMSEFNGFTHLRGILPIFTGTWGGVMLFYAPGFLAAARSDEAERIKGVLSGEIPPGNLIAHQLTEAALSARDQWIRIHEPRNYQPTCLTLYTSLACSLRCSYCFAEPERNEKARLTKDFVLASARKVLENCRAKEEFFTAVFHGGGEPTLDPIMPDLHEALRKLCEGEHVPFRSYLATNGVMSENKAVRFSKIFSRIGLSVDGPPDIQNKQRPQRNGDKTSHIVERTAGIIRQETGKLTVRVTVLPENYSRIPEIAGYCRDILGADLIRIEPAYFQNTDPESADEFCSAFLKAEKTGYKLSYSGSRLGEIHGRYCQVFRQVLHLVPPNGHSVCFAVSTLEEGIHKGLHKTHDKALHLMLQQEDSECADCFNRFHCSRGCPEICPARQNKPYDSGSFRCRVNRRLAEAKLLDLAEQELMNTAVQYGYAGITLRGR